MLNPAHSKNPCLIDPLADFYDIQTRASFGNNLVMSWIFAAKKPNNVKDEVSSTELLVEKHDFCLLSRSADLACDFWGAQESRNGAHERLFRLCHQAEVELLSPEGDHSAAEKSCGKRFRDGPAKSRHLFDRSLKVTQPPSIFERDR
jgi:hypothetical protein